MTQSERGSANGALRPVFRNLPPYQPPPTEADFVPVQADMLRLNLNEAAFAPSPRVMQAIARAAAELNRYPDPRARVLKTKLADSCGVRAEQIALGNGSDELIQLALSTALEPGDPLILPTPSFGRYASAAKFLGAVPQAVPVRADGACDIAGMLTRAKELEAAMVVATPNNPTGGMLTAQELRRLSQEAPADRLLLIDEAYFEFAVAEGGPNALQELASRKGGFIVLRTLSKAYGIAGLRVGYAIGSDPALVQAIDHARGAFNVGALAQAGALAALEDRAHMEKIVGDTIAERERLRARLLERSFRCLPSAANFLAVELPREADVVTKALAARGILVSILGGAPFHRHIRVSIGSPQQNDRFLEELLAALAA